MEGKRSPIGSPSSGSSSSSSFSLASELFGSPGKSSSSSSSSGLFNSIFAPPSSVGGRESSRSDIFGTYGKKQDSAGGFWNQSTADGISRGDQSRGQNNLFSKEGNSIYQGEKIDTCPLSSSLYYGGQDIYNHISDSHYSNPSYNFQQRSYTNNGDDNRSGSPIDRRGDWWKGSFHY